MLGIEKAAKWVGWVLVATALALLAWQAADMWRVFDTAVARPASDGNKVAAISQLAWLSSYRMPILSVSALGGVALLIVARLIKGVRRSLLARETP